MELRHLSPAFCLWHRWRKSRNWAIYFGGGVYVYMVQIHTYWSCTARRHLGGQLLFLLFGFIGLGQGRNRRSQLCCYKYVLWAEVVAHTHHHRKRSWGGPIRPENHVKTPNPEGVHHHIGNIWELQLTRALHWGLFGGKLSLLAWPNSMMCQETNPALNGGFNGKIIYKW